MHDRHVTFAWLTPRYNLTVACCLVTLIRTQSTVLTAYTCTLTAEQSSTHLFLHSEFTVLSIYFCEIYNYYCMISLYVSTHNAHIIPIALHDFSRSTPKFHCKMTSLIISFFPRFLDIRREQRQTHGKNSLFEFAFHSTLCKVYTDRMEQEDCYEGWSCWVSVQWYV